MRIEEVTQNQPITLLVNIEGQQLSFESQILEVYPKKHLVLAKAVYHDEKIITFRRKDIVIDVLLNMEDDKPQLFKNVSVTLVRKNDDTLCYNLATSSESRTYNRRENFRCYVGVATSFQCGANKSAHMGTIRDVSVNGFAIVSDSEISAEPGQVIHTILKDTIETNNEKFVFHLYGIIARIQPLERGGVLYGCRLNNYIPALEAYIMKKERVRLKRLNGGDL